MNNSLALNSLGGTFSAVNGSIQLGTTEILNNVMNINALGGNFVSDTLNINADAGLLSAEFNTVGGTVNLRAHQAYMGVTEGDLKIGHQFVNGDPYEFTDGNLTFTGITDVDFLTVSANNIFANSSEGPVGIFAAGSINLTASGFINLAGTGIIASNSGQVNLHSNGSISLPGAQILTNGQQIALVSEDGAIVAPGLNVQSNGGRILIAGKNDVVLSDGKVSANISSGKGNSIGGNIFITSLAGGVNLGTKSVVSTGFAPPTQKGGIGAIIPISISAFNGIVANEVTATGGDIFVGSGYATQRLGGGFLVPTSGGQGEGGIVLATVSSETGESIGPGSITVNASNGDLFATSIHGNGKNVTVGSSHDINLEEGITNVSKNDLHNFVSVFAGRNIVIPDGIINNNLVGEGGIVDVFAQQAGGLNIGGSGLHIENDAATHGGTVQIGNAGSLNIGAGGISAKAGNGNGSSILLQAYATESGPSALTVSTKLDMADAATEGYGGEISLYAEGPVTFSSTQFSANGAGTGSGGRISIRSEQSIHAENATLMANGGSDGSGGNIEIYAPDFTGGNFNLFANGNGTGVGGYNYLSLTEGTSASSGQIAMTATGANGGVATITAVGDLHVDTSVFNVKALSTEEGYGNGGTVSLESQGGTLSIGGDISVDAIGTGSGGEIYLRSGGTETFVLGSDSKLFARGGSSGSANGSGGRIQVRTGGDLTVNPEAVLSVSVRGLNGSGGVVSLAAGDFFGPSGPSLLTLNRNLSVNGKGTGNGGSIFLASSGGIKSGGIIVNGTLQANSGLLGDEAGHIQIDMWGLNGLGTLSINKSMSANAGENGRGGSIEIGQLGSSLFGNGTTNLQIASTSQVSVLGGTASGDGGRVKVSGAGVVSIDGQINASARGLGEGGRVEIQSNSILTEGESAINISGSVKADGGTFGTGGVVSITGDGTSINVDTGSSVSARSGSSGGIGGEISGLSDAGITVEAATLDASGRGAANGGVVRLQLRDVDLEGGPVETFAFLPLSELSFETFEANDGQIRLTGSTIKADAGASGTGGTILVKTEGGQRNISIQEGTMLSAYGGTQSGDAGSVEISGQGMFETSAGSSIFANARGGGNGGSITLSQTGSKELIANGDLYASGAKTGKGGNVLLTTESSGTDLLVGQGGSSQIAAKGGSSKGGGGTVNFVSGKDLKLGASNTNVSATSGDAGTVRASGSNVDCENSIIVATSNSGTGGTVEKTGDVLEVKEGETHSRNVDSSSGKAGTITYNFRKYVIDGTLHLRANSDTGSAGSVNLNASEEIVLGKGHIDLSASGVTRANGGNVNFTTPLLSNTDETQTGQGTLRIFTNGTGTSRSAGSVNLIVGSYGIDKGTVLLSASGVEGAGGGNVNASITSVVGRGSAPSQAEGEGGVGTGPAQLIFSQITTEASGVIEIQSMTEGAKGINGVSIDSAEQIVVRNGGINTQGNANGNGNDVAIASSKGILISSSNESTAFAINANASGAGSGGAISFESPELKIQGSAAVTADGGTSGAGGSITNAHSTTNVSIGDVGAAGAPVQLLARGGTSAGGGGQLRLNAQDQVKVIAAVLDVSARSANGNGGSVVIESPNMQFGDQAASSAVTVRASAGVNKGTAGSIRLSGAGSSSADQITVAKDSNLFAGSRIGELVIKTNALVIENESIMNGEAHVVDASIQAGSGNGVLSLNVSGTGAGKGNGTINLRTHDLNFAQTELFAQGNAGAKAGRIQINEANGIAGVSFTNVLANAESDTTNDTNGSIIVNSQNDLSISDSIFSAVGKSGGRVDITISDPDAGILTLKGVHVDVSGAAGSGGQVNVVAHNIIQSGTIELIAAGTGAGGTVNLRQADSTAVLALGDEHLFRVNADGQWRSNPPSAPSVSLISAGELVLGELASLSSSSSSLGAKTFGGFIRLSAGNGQPVAVNGTVAANGNRGRIEILANEFFLLTENGRLSATGTVSSGNIDIVADTSSIAGSITAAGNDGVLAIRGSKLTVAANGAINANEIRVNSDINDLHLDLHGSTIGNLILDGNTILVNYGSDKTSSDGLIRVAHAFATGSIAFLNRISSKSSAIVIAGGVEPFSIRSTSGDVEMRAADSISLEESQNTRIRGTNVFISQLNVDDPANKEGYVSLGCSIEALSIEVLAQGNIRGRGGELIANTIKLTSSFGTIGSPSNSVYVRGPFSELGTFIMPTLRLSANQGSAYVQSIGGMVVEAANARNSLRLSHRIPNLVSLPGASNTIFLHSVGDLVAPQNLVVETSQQSDGDIVILGPVKATNLATIEAGGNGSILGSFFGRIEAKNIELRTLYGDIHGGSLTPDTGPSFALATVATSLKVNATGTVVPGSDQGNLPIVSGGVVLVNNQSNSLTLKSSTGGALLSIRSSGRLAIASGGEIKAGSIALISDGSLTVNSGATIESYNGSTELFAREAFTMLSGSKIVAKHGNVGIVGGTRVDLTGATVSANAIGTDPVGYVSIATLTPSDTELVPATDLANFKVNGAVFWGSGRLRALNGANRASGNGREVIFNSDRGNITLSEGTVVEATGIDSGSNQSPLSPIGFNECSNTVQRWGGASLPVGSYVFNATHDLFFKIEKGFVTVMKGAWIHIESTENAFIVRNLLDSHRHSVIAETNGVKIELNQGEELVLGRADVSSTPYRNSKCFGQGITLREFSIPALISSATVIRDIFKQDPQFRTRLLKVAVSIATAFAGRGAYGRR